MHAVLAFSQVDCARESEGLSPAIFKCQVRHLQTNSIVNILISSLASGIIQIGKVLLGLAITQLCH